MTTKAPIEFEVVTPQGIKIVSRMVPWTVAMRSIVIKERLDIEKQEGMKVIHAFQDEVCLMRKFRIPVSG